MYDHQLDTFLLVARTGSFSAAGAESYISPSAISQQMTLLEKKLGATLFVRSKRGVTLTDAGRALEREAPKLIHASQTLIDAVSRGAKPLRLGWNTGLEDERFIDICAAFRAQGLALTPFPEGNVFRALEEQTIDLCVYIESPRYKKMGYRFVPLYTARQVVVAPPTHPLSRLRTATLRDLSGARLYLLRGGMLTDHDALSKKVLEEGLPIRLCALPDYGFSTRARIFEEDALFLGIDRFAWQYAPLCAVPLEDGAPIHIGLVMCEDDDSRLKAIEQAVRDGDLRKVE